MGAPMKCLACDARWYGMGSSHCADCGSDDIDVDAMPAEPDARMLEMIALVRSGCTNPHDERFDQFFDDRGNGLDTFNLCIDLRLVRASGDGPLSICETQKPK